MEEKIYKLAIASASIGSNVNGKGFESRSNYGEKGEINDNAINEFKDRVGKVLIFEVSRQDLLRIVDDVSRKIEEIFEKLPLLAELELENLFSNTIKSNDNNSIHPDERKLVA